MDQKFKKILQKTKAWNQGNEPLAHTFEGALFKDSGWVFSFDESLSQLVEPASVSKPQIKPLQALKETASKGDFLSLVVFVGDTYSEEKGEDLLGKMIQAMKLKSGEFHRIPFDEKMEEINDLSQNFVTPTPETLALLEKIKIFKPQYVVSLGATITNILLGKRDKLSGIHGQFFDKKININNDSYTYHLMPIFHPDFLIINPNMKRTAWIDLQKIMERVGKI